MKCSWCGHAMPADWPPGAMHVTCAARAVETEARAARGRPAVIPMPPYVRPIGRLADQPTHAQDVVAAMRQAEHGGLLPGQLNKEVGDDGTGDH